LLIGGRWGRLINYDKIIYYRIIKNKGTPDFSKIINSIPHRDYLDFIVVYYIKEGSDLSILITNKLINALGVTESQLFNVASNNTPILEKVVIKTTKEIILNCIEDSVVDKSINKMIDSDVIYVVTNKDKYLGATTVLYPDLVKGIAEDLNRDLYIIFPSVHEFIIIDTEARTSSHRIKSAIRTINETLVEPGEVLSDNLYRYCLASDTIKIVE
jgi:hypothetical protein